MSYLLEDMVKTAGWLVDKEKRQRVQGMKHLGHNLKLEKWDGRRMKGQADLLQPKVDVLRNKVEHAQKGYSDALAEKYKKLELEEQLNPTMYDRKEPNERLRARLRIQFNGPEWEKLREAEDEHSKVDGKFSDYDYDAKRHQRKAMDLENDIKSQAKEYGEGFFGPNPKLKKDLQRKERRIVGAGIAGAAAIGGSSYLYGRYKKKKRAEAEQEKAAASSDIKSAGLMAAGGLGLTTASLYGSLAMQKRLKKKYGDIDGVNETSILSGIGNDRATNRINPTREQRERAEKFRKSFNRLNFGSRVGMGVGAGLGTTGAAMLGDAISRR